MINGALAALAYCGIGVLMCWFFESFVKKNVELIDGGFRISAHVSVPLRHYFSYVYCWPLILMYIGFKIVERKLSK